ncbi:hypothetical protein V1514DRAFT_342363 [Lipomyces japonicus]|uniref:uncharacterized protein n=1 Tax=Lipomyces japonicus TaxID=56871 RepID=UPI0034CD7B65
MPKKRYQYNRSFYVRNRRIPGTNGVIHELKRTNDNIIKTVVHARPLPTKDGKEDYSMYCTSSNKKPFSFKKRKAVDDISNQWAAAKDQQNLLEGFEKNSDGSLVCVGTDISAVKVVAQTRKNADNRAAEAKLWNEN